MSVTGNTHFITLTNLELTYELAFLRVYLAWETLLEDTLVRLFCGYQNSAGQEPLVRGRSYYPSLADAEAALLGGKDYKLWHTPSVVTSRAKSLLANSRYELTIASASSRLSRFACVRHRIAHSQKHAKREFDKATMALSGKRYRSSRAGRFLRDWNTAFNPHARWIDSTFQKFAGLAYQLCS